MQGLTTTSAVQFFTLQDTGECVGSSIYTTGTASQSGTTVTGSGTTFTSAMAPGIICWVGVTTCSFITTFGSTTSLTTSNSASVSLAAFKLCSGAFETAQGSVHVAGSIYSGLTANRMVITGSNGLLSAPTALTNGQLFIGNTGNAPSAATLTSGATTTITITNGAGTITIDTSQALTTSSNPTFASLTLSGLTQHRLVLVGASGLLSNAPAQTNGQLLIGSAGADPVAASPTSTGGTISVTPGPGSLNFDIAPHATISTGSFTPLCAVAIGMTTYNTGTVNMGGAIITAVGGGRSPVRD